MCVGAITSGEGGDTMIKLRVYNEGNFSAEQIRQLAPILLPYGMRFVSLEAVTGEFYDFIMTVKI